MSLIELSTVVVSTQILMIASRMSARMAPLVLMELPLTLANAFLVFWENIVKQVSS